jgi:hypothetical protein
MSNDGILQNVLRQQPDCRRLIERTSMAPDKTSGKLPATLIPGDGIGPEIVKSAVE